MIKLLGAKLNIYIKNISWLIVEKLLIMVSGLVISMMVARYLGPEELGKITFSIVLTNIPIIICQWGSNQIIYNVSARNPRKAVCIINATENGRIALYISIWLVITAYLLVKESEIYTAVLMSLVVLFHLFIGLDIYQYYYNATLTSKVNAKSSMIASLASMAFRGAAIGLKAETIAFIFPFLVNNVIIYFLRKKELISIGFLGKKYREYFFIRGFPHMLVSLISFFSIKASALILAIYTSYADFAQYSIAFTLAYAWVFLPQSVGTSLLAKPLKQKGHEQNKGFSFVNLSIICISMPALIVFYVFPSLIVNVTFGPSYNMAHEILFPLALSAMISILNWVNNRIIASYKNGGRFLVKKTIISFLISIPLSYFLVYKYGLLGAAWSIVIMEAVSFSFLNYFFKRGEILYIHINIPSSISYIRSVK
ncbi:oligosaccharide flippase family protein [Vibrio metschnikovii]|nr:oligosaccharide flippase family protein [Vibrio metschnikovii]